MGLNIGVNAKKMKTTAIQPWKSFHTSVLACKRMTHKQRQFKTRRRPGDPLADTPT